MDFHPGRWASLQPCLKKESLGKAIEHRGLKDRGQSSAEGRVPWPACLKDSRSPWRQQASHPGSHSRSSQPAVPPSGAHGQTHPVLEVPEQGPGLLQARSAAHLQFVGPAPSSPSHTTFMLPHFSLLESWGQE